MSTAEQHLDTPTDGDRVFHVLPDGGHVTVLTNVVGPGETFTIPAARYEETIDRSTGRSFLDEAEQIRRFGRVRIAAGQGPKPTPDNEPKRRHLSDPAVEGIKRLWEAETAAAEGRRVVWRSTHTGEAATVQGVPEEPSPSDH